MKPKQSKYIPLVGFQSRKAAQICAYFAKHSGVSITKLKLIKLVYLAERDFLGKCGHPMLYDEFYSLKDGPICSSTLNGINGLIDKEIWSQFITRNGKLVSAKENFSRSNLDEISDVEMDTLETSWKGFGWMSASQIRNYTHEHCPEYTELTSGRSPISYKEVLEALGEVDAEELEKEIMYFRKTEAILRA